jgi:apolipoprotein N-acyltransferase
MKFLALLLRPLAAIASGLGIAALFPPYSVGKLVWLVMVPLLVALWSLGEKRRRRKAFLLGYLAGCCFFLPNLSWLRSVSDVGWVALSLYLAVFPAVWALFVATLGNPWRGGRRDGLLTAPLYAFACAATWASLEWLRSWLFTGFGWNPLGVAFHETPVFAQSADLLGACGLSMLPVFAQAVLVQVCVRRTSQYHSAVIRRQVALGMVVLMMGSAYAYGVWRITSSRQGESIRLKALLVQLNIPQEAARPLWTATEVHLGYEDDTLEALEKLGSNTPDWIMWPETALTGRILRADDGNWGMWQQNVDTIERIREKSQATLVLGVNETEADAENGMLMMKEDGKEWNSLAILQADPDQPLQTFRKHHLVIFGEYIPLVDKLPFLAKIYEQQSGVEFGGGLSIGDSLDPLNAVVRGESFGVIPTVCFEDTVPRLMRKFVRKGPQLIVNVTNDGWFKETAGAAQHFANARFRAIELRRPMIRCANTGVSAAVTSTGTTLHPDGGKPQELRDANGNHFTRGSLLAEVDIPKNPPTTLYAMVGDWGVIVLGVLGFGGMVLRQRRGEEMKVEEEESQDD